MCEVSAPDTEQEEDDEQRCGDTKEPEKNVDHAETSSRGPRRARDESARQARCDVTAGSCVIAMSVRTRRANQNGRLDAISTGLYWGNAGSPTPASSSVLQCVCVADPRATGSPGVCGGVVATHARRTSATLHAWAMQPRGVNGGSASNTSLIEPRHASSRCPINPSSRRRAPDASRCTRSQTSTSGPMSHGQTVPW